MSDVSAILLIPSDEHREALLREGPCGARPPMAARWLSSGHWMACDEDWHDGRGENRRAGVADYIWLRALALAWKGEIVPEGTERAERHRPRARDGGIFLNVHRALARGVGAGDAVRLACASLGTIILLDSDGREVPHV